MIAILFVKPLNIQPNSYQDTKRPCSLP